MNPTLRIVIAQLDFTVGDLESNLQKHIAAAIKARDMLGAHVILFPELSMTGYPPEDLLFRKKFIDQVDKAIAQLKKEIMGIYCIVGHPKHSEQGLQNVCSILYDGGIVGFCAKKYLPNYSVFDEHRYFTPGNTHCVVPIHDIPVGLVICEDLWKADPIQSACSQGARIILSPNASPYEIDKFERRIQTFSKQAKNNDVPILYANYIGAQDELVFDGSSMVIDETGKVAQVSGFKIESLHPVDIEVSASNTKIAPIPFHVPNTLEKIYDALCLGLHEYIQKNNFPGAIVGTSGGIDSALTLCLACDTLGKDRVSSLILPSRHTSQMSMLDAKTLAKSLQIEPDIISIEPAYQSFLDSLAPLFKEYPEDVTEENIQSRCRAVILMAVSNKTGRLVLATGNRSELAVGYTTIYGDLAGGFSVLKDVSKTLVYQLARYRNLIDPVIPENTLMRAPSAELAPNQKDEDTLPAYSILDAILDLYLNQEKEPDEIIANGFEKETVYKIIKLIHQNEYKRRQAPIGPRINHKSFGRDRRYPITSKFKK